MRLKAQRKIGEESVCAINGDDRNGTIRVKPTTFNAGVNIKASVLCATCDCEKVKTHIQG